MKKKTLSLVLALVMCLGLLPAMVFAANSDSDFQIIDYAEYGISEKVLTHYTGPGGDVIIPDGVTAIETGAFMDCKNITSLTIPDSVTTIYKNAFSGCASLTSLTISNGVSYIGAEAFSDCISLTGVTIPASVDEIVNGVFARCSNLTSIQVDPGNQKYLSKDGIVFSKTMDTLVAYPAGRRGAYTIPDGITNIEMGAFSGCAGLTSVYIPNSVANIDNFAFCDCTALTEITIPENITKINRCAFSSCTGLTRVNIPDSITTIGWGAFSECTSLSSITIPDSVTHLEMGAFTDCTGLTSIAIPASVTNIGSWAFENCPALKDVYYAGTDTQWKAVQISTGNDALTSATIHYNSTMPQQPVQPTANQAQPTNDTLTRDGEPQNPTVYKIGDSNYFKIRDLAAILNGTEKQFSVGYDSEKQSVTATTGQGYTKLDGDLAGPPAGQEKAEASSDAIYVNGQKVEAEVYKIGGNNYFKLRDLGKALNFYVGYDSQTGIFIDTSKPYSE